MSRTWSYKVLDLDKGLQIDTSLGLGLALLVVLEFFEEGVVHLGKEVVVAVDQFVQLFLEVDRVDDVVAGPVLPFEGFVEALEPGEVVLLEGSKLFRVLGESLQVFKWDYF